MSAMYYTMNEFRSHWSYLEKYYDSWVRYYEKWLIPAYKVSGRDTLSFLPMFNKNPSLDIFPDDVVVAIEMPYLNEVRALFSSYKQFYRTDVLQVLLLAPFNHPSLHPAAGNDVDWYSVSEESDIACLHEFLRQMEIKGKTSNMRLSISNGKASLVIGNHTQWLNRCIKSYVDRHTKLYGKAPVKAAFPIMPKRRPSFESYLAYNTLRYLRSVFEIKAFLPHSLCEFICHYVNIVLCHLSEVVSDNMAHEKLSYSQVYTMLNNNKKSYGDTCIPIQYVKI